MGYLDGSTVTVDATLTKAGRRILAEGGSINPVGFSVHDTEVDYSLWNGTHSSGSDYYGEQIENLPLLEATPHQDSIIQDALFTMTDSNVTSIPYIPQLFQGADSYDFGTLMTGVTVTIRTYNWTGSPGYALLVPDSRKLKITPMEGQRITVGDLTGHFKYFLATTKNTNPQVYYLSQGGNYEFAPQAWSESQDWEMNITAVNLDIGTYRSAVVKGSNNVKKTYVDRGNERMGKR